MVSDSIAVTRQLDGLSIADLRPSNYVDVSDFISDSPPFQSSVAFAESLALINSSSIVVSDSVAVTGQLDGSSAVAETVGEDSNVFLWSEQFNLTDLFYGSVEFVCFGVSDEIDYCHGMIPSSDLEKIERIHHELSRNDRRRKRESR
jgi:hypothetical protein